MKNFHSSLTKLTRTVSRDRLPKQYPLLISSFGALSFIIYLLYHSSTASQSDRDRASGLVFVSSIPDPNEREEREEGQTEGQRTERPLCRCPPLFCWCFPVSCAPLSSCVRVCSYDTRFLYLYSTVLTNDNSSCIRSHVIENAKMLFHPIDCHSLIVLYTDYCRNLRTTLVQPFFRRSGTFLWIKTRH